MTLSELATALREMYETASPGEVTTMVRLFGVKFAKEIDAIDGSCKDIAVAAEISHNYGTEISKGARLAKYVKLK